MSDVKLVLIYQILNLNFLTKIKKLELKISALIMTDLFMTFKFINLYDFNSGKNP
jgi:hypothetical protein